VRRLALSTGLSFAVSILWSCSAPATETENHGIAVLPAPGKVTIDGKTGDWDLSGGIFACGDVENQRERMAVWIHAMYDRENLYVLARWRDETPMNNPRQALAGMGFNGDCLQLRIVTHPGTPQERCSHWDAWRDCNGQDVLSAQYGKQLNEGNLGDAKAKGAKLAFLKDPDGKGYVQEMALPWALLTKDGRPQQAGEQLTMTVEPNFTIGADGRLTIKDIFKPGVSIDRVFTFMSSQVWGTATLERKGRIAPRPVRLSDAREFQVRMENGVPVVDWKGLIKQKEAAGFAPVRFAMPEDGYVSLHLRSGDGTVVRQLLNCEFRSKGPHEVKWDGLSTPIWRQPGERSRRASTPGRRSTTRGSGCGSAASRPMAARRPGTIRPARATGAAITACPAPRRATRRRSISAGRAPRPARPCWLVTSKAGCSGTTPTAASAARKWWRSTAGGCTWSATWIRRATRASCSISSTPARAATSAGTAPSRPIWR